MEYWVTKHGLLSCIQMWKMQNTDNDFTFTAKTTENKNPCMNSVVFTQRKISLKNPHKLKMWFMILCGFLKKHMKSM